MAPRRMLTYSCLALAAVLVAAVGIASSRSMMSVDFTTILGGVTLLGGQQQSRKELQLPEEVHERVEFQEPEENELPRRPAENKEEATAENKEESTEKEEAAAESQEEPAELQAERAEETAAEETGDPQENPQLQQVQQTTTTAITTTTTTTTPITAKATQTAGGGGTAEDDYGDGNVPTFTSGQALPVSAQAGLPDSKHWWRTNPVLLEQILEEAESAHKLSLRKRNEHGPLGEFLRNKGSATKQNKWFLDGLLVPTYQCPAEYRLGSWVDGGKWVCMSYRRKADGAPPMVVSIGVNGETSFEEAVFKELGAISHGVDFSMEPAVAERVRALEFMKLYEVGLCGSENRKWYRTEHPRVKWVTIHDLLRMIPTRYVDILKIDCESCEYGVVKDLSTKYHRGNVPFGQIQMELHSPQENLPQTFETLSCLEKLGFRIFHAEINRFTDKYEMYHYEIALIHESRVKPLL